jgi:MerR family transcriptional regulator, thiopeptide resistance regulator
MATSQSAGQYTVSEATGLTHISPRALHYYHELGLLTPSGRSTAGYRLYSEADLRRLRQILFYRELDFRLDEILEILADPNAGTDDHLRRQHRLLRQRSDRTDALIGAIEKEMEARKMGIALTPEEQFEIFGTDKMDEYAAEAEQRWGDSEAWKQSERKSAVYTKEDWITIKAEADANIAGFADALRAGEPPASTVAMDLAEAHRQHISRWFYDCGFGMHRGLAEMYISDPRFIATYDEIEPGFSHYVHDAIQANADRNT